MENLSDEDRAAIATAKAQALEQTKEAFKGLDTDGNGTVERAELLALMQQKGGPGVDMDKIKEFFDTFDADGDGKVSEAEWLEFFGAMFDATMAQQMSA